MVIVIIVSIEIRFPSLEKKFHRRKKRKPNLENRYFFQTGIFFENQTKTTKKKNMNFMWKTWNFFRSIQEESYKEEIARRNIDVFLLDGRARVTDPTFPYNKTSFHFTYLKVRIF